MPQPLKTVRAAEDVDALVIGAGPAGLMAAEHLAAAGRSVVIAEKMPTAGRKFLMAGKSGLNLTKVEAEAKFLAAYREAAPKLSPMLQKYGPDWVQDWAKGLGQTVFTGSTGRVFPTVMKASPLLRAWLARLESLGVDLRLRWTALGWENGTLRFETPEGIRALRPKATVLAMGGSSWRKLGSDGRWVDWLDETTVAFGPANMGVCVQWSPHIDPHLGKPLKGIALHGGETVSRGEIVLSARGLEGGGIYALSPEIRAGVPLELDLLPDQSFEMLRDQLTKVPRKVSASNLLRKGAGLSDAKRALVQEWGRPVPRDPAALAKLLKALPVRHDGPRPLDEAISVSGGLKLDTVDETLMLRNRPGVFPCGEMLDWEAPTGGYLLTACLATGAWAGDHAARWSG